MEANKIRNSWMYLRKLLYSYFRMVIFAAIPFIIGIIGAVLKAYEVF